MLILKLQGYGRTHPNKSDQPKFTQIIGPFFYPGLCQWLRKKGFEEINTGIFVRHGKMRTHENSTGVSNHSCVRSIFAEIIKLETQSFSISTE